MEYNHAAGRFSYSTMQFKVYEDYLDSKVTSMDVFYLKVSFTLLQNIWRKLYC